VSSATSGRAKRSSALAFTAACICPMGALRQGIPRTKSWLVRAESGSVGVLDHGAPGFRCWVRPDICGGDLRQLLSGECGSRVLGVVAVGTGVGTYVEVRHRQVIQGHCCSSERARRQAPTGLPQRLAKQHCRHRPRAQCSSCSDAEASFSLLLVGEPSSLAPRSMTAPSPVASKTRRLLGA
jgi:hypothetical protein